MVYSLANPPSNAKRIFTRPFATGNMGDKTQDPRPETIHPQNPVLSAIRPSFHRICGKARGKVNDAAQKWLTVLDFLLFAQQLCINVTPVLSTDTAVCDFADTSWTSASFTANGCLIFNDSASGDPAVCAIAFGGDKTVSSGTFTIQFPTADASDAIIRIA